MINMPIDEGLQNDLLLLILGAVLGFLSALLLSSIQSNESSKERDKLTKYEVAKNILGYKYQLFSDSIDHNHEIMYWMNMIPAVFSNDKEVMKIYVDFMSIINLESKKGDNKLENTKNELLLELLREVLVKSGMVNKEILSDEIIRDGLTLKKKRN